METMSVHLKYLRNNIASFGVFGAFRMFLLLLAMFDMVFCKDFPG